MSQPLIIILVIAAYISLLLLVSKLTSKGADNSTYFTGNRNMAWPLVALAMITAPITGVTFVSVPGMVASKGFVYLQMCLGFVVGYFLISLVLIPLFYRKKIISIYSFLNERFGRSAYKTGAWLFLVSEVLGIGLRFLVVCISLQMLVFAPLGLPFALNVIITMVLMWAYTAKGGVKTVIWSDSVKSICLLLSVILCFVIISRQLPSSSSEIPGLIWQRYSSSIFFFDDPMSPSYFWKQFLAGVFLVVAMTGLDQDMMQRVLACKDSKSSRKNMVVSGITQFLIIAFFLTFGGLLMLYMEQSGINMPEKTDDIFATVAFHESLPIIVSLLFVLGLISASYSSMGSALTSLTTSFTIDILEADKKGDEIKLRKTRRLVHAGSALVMMVVILLFYYLNHQDAISALFTLASYVYGPILGLFVFGIFSSRVVNTKLIPWICILSPCLSWVLAWTLNHFWGYETGYEIFLLNAFITWAGISLLPSESREFSSALLNENLQS